MGPRLEIEVPRPAPAADFYVVLFALAVRYGFVRNVGDSQHQFSKTKVDFAHFFVHGLDFVADGPHRLDEPGRFLGILAHALQASYLLRGVIALGLEPLHLGHQRPAPRVQLQKLIQRHGLAPPAHGLPHGVRIFTDKLDIQQSGCLPATACVPCSSLYMNEPQERNVAAATPPRRSVPTAMVRDGRSETRCPTRRAPRVRVQGGA